MPSQVEPEVESPTVVITEYDGRSNLSKNAKIQVTGCLEYSTREKSITVVRESSRSFYSVHPLEPPPGKDSRYFLLGISAFLPRLHTPVMPSSSSKTFFGRKERIYLTLIQRVHCKNT
jgi:hypothetical protein